MFIYYISTFPSLALCCSIDYLPIDGTMWYFDDYSSSIFSLVSLQCNIERKREIILEINRILTILWSTFSIPFFLFWIFCHLPGFMNLSMQKLNTVFYLIQVFYFWASLDTSIIIYFCKFRSMSDRIQHYSCIWNCFLLENDCIQLIHSTLFCFPESWFAKWTEISLSYFWFLDVAWFSHLE